MVTTQKHTGKNIKAIREILRVKQEVLADALGVSQQSISLLEQRETVEHDLLERVANILKVPVEAIENYREDTTVSFISNTYTNTNNDNVSNGIQNSPTLNYYADKLIELYERMLKEKDAEIERLRQEKNK
ncbi:DNA-binding transcriptional regulator, XRE-family HTH domain [Chitinophaga sp. CF118]|uniref:helix-turn-helix domain-containing protein n=1 Tax=Chitinophaga sp. CF118 TaxID=1884367 RepID=UPI0008E0A914|nr:helix-turn-helix transcriptional regulator [Chitinophaga sp. CF118]SFD77393.1 DNA-binding transcriptional regulator, XRE-family HTH domain [Chitinophaga sp. CF118]